MGAPAAVSVARSSAATTASAKAAGSRAKGVKAGMPVFMTVGSGGKAQGQIEAMKQQEETDDRSVAEGLADRLGQPDSRAVMEAEDAKDAAAKSQEAQDGQAIAQESAQSGDEAVSRLPDPAEQVSRADGGDGLVAPAGQQSASQSSQADGDQDSDGADGGGAGGGGSGGGGGGGGGAGAGAGGDGKGQGAKADGAAGGPDAAGGKDSKGADGGAGDAGPDGPLAEDVPRDGAPAEAPDTGAGDLGTGDLVLIDVELAEHQRWAAAEEVVGAAGSEQRAEFIAQTAGEGFVGGVASGAAMGLELGLISRAVPQLGAIMGGKQALDAILDRDWDATADTLGKFGQGSDIYDTLANTLSAVNEIIVIANNVCDYIGGIIAVVEVAAIAVAAGSAVLAFFTFGATAGIAVEAGELADVCEEMREAVSEVSTVLNEISNHLLQPCILLFRALHQFTADADPREIEAGGHELSGAAGAIGGALGGWIGGQAANIGGHAPPQDGEGTNQRPPHETPPAPEGLAPEVHFEDPPPSATPPGEPAGLPSAADVPAIDTPAPAEPQQAPMQVADSETVPEPAAASTPSEPVTAAAAAAPAPSVPSEQLNLAGIPPAGKTGGKLEAPIAPLQLRAFGSGTPAPKGLEVGSIGTYGRAVANPHEVALESNPPGAPGATATGGRMPKGGREAAGVYLEHQTPAAVAAEVIPGYVHTVPGGPKRGGSGTKEALTVAFPESVKPFKDAADAQLLAEVKARKANNEDIMPAEVIARGAKNSQDAIAAAGAAVPPEQVAKAFLAEMEVFQTDPKFGYEEFRPGDKLPADSPLRGLTDAEIDTHLDNLFDEHLYPMPPKGGQVEMFPGVKPKAPAEPAPPETQLSMGVMDKPGVPAGQGELFAPHAGESASKPTDAEPMQVADQPATRGTEALSPEHRQSLYEQAVQMGHDPAKIKFWDGPTEFDPNTGELRIGPNVAPLPPAQRPKNLRNPANAALDQKSVLAHEIIGHSEAAQGGATRPVAWQEEYQASIRAALHMENATEEQHANLMSDAEARKRFAEDDDDFYIDINRYGAAAQAQKKAGGPKEDVGQREPSVIIDPSLYEPAPATPEPAMPPAARDAEPAARPPQAAAAPEQASPVPAAHPATPTGRGGGEAPAKPGIGTRIANLFLPQEHEKGPSFAEQQAAHRAEFTADNQPAAGVERVNPHYSAPPGTPDQIVALQNEILNLLAVRARAEAESQHEGERIDACEDNRGPITQTLADTRSGISAARAHEQAVARHDAANQAQQQRQQQSAELTGGYGDKAAGMAVIEGPLAAWEGFTSLASHLPGSAGDKMAAMNAEAQKMQDAFGQMGAHMLGADGAQPARAASLSDDSARIGATGVQAQSSHQEMQTAATGAAGLQSANEKTLAAAQQRQQAADERGDELQSAADDRQASADSLAAQMQAWAQTHRDERAQAVAATVARLQSQGKIVTQSPTE